MAGSPYFGRALNLESLNSLKLHYYQALCSPLAGASWCNCSPAMDQRRSDVAYVETFHAGAPNRYEIEGFGTQHL